MQVLCSEDRQPLQRLELHTVQSARRRSVEQLISDVYRDRYDAQPPRFAPLLVSLSDAHGPVAAAGYRAAADGPLFLEQYLDRPIESWLPKTDGHAVPRAQIVEVGHLAAARAGEGRRLIHDLTLHLGAAGFTWVVSTVTRELRQLFLRLGIVPIAVAPAHAEALGDERVRWGRYYEHEPVILAGHLPQALHRLTTARAPARPAAGTPSEGSEA